MHDMADLENHWIAMHIAAAVVVICRPLQLGMLLSLIAQRQNVKAANYTAMRRGQSRGAAPGLS